MTTEALRRISCFDAFSSRQPVPASLENALFALALSALRVAGGVEAEVGHRLLVELAARLNLLALLELLESVLGFRSPPAIRATDLEPVLVERLLSLTDLATRQVLLRLIVLRSLLLLRLLVLLGLVRLLLLGLWLLHLTLRCSEHRRTDHRRRQQRDSDLSHSAFSKKSIIPGSRNGFSSSVNAGETVLLQEPATIQDEMSVR
jgi:hypothetical protein